MVTASQSRFICILSTYARVLERLCIPRVLERALLRRLPSSAFGFREGHGCIDAAFSLQRYINAVRRKCIPVLALFYDERKAFPGVSKSRVLQKLRPHVSGKVIELYERFLRDTVFTMETVEGKVTVKPLHGVAEGSATGPLGFTLVYSDIVQRATRAVQLEPPQDLDVHYADDSGFAVWRLEKLRLLDAALRARLPGARMALNVLKSFILFRGDGGGVDLPYQKVPFGKHLGTLVSVEKSGCSMATQHAVYRIGCASPKVRLGLSMRRSQLHRESLRTLFRVCIAPTVLYGVEVYPWSAAAMRRYHVYSVMVWRKWLRMHNYVSDQPGGHTSNEEVLRASGTRCLCALAAVQIVEWVRRVWFRARRTAAYGWAHADDSDIVPDGCGRRGAWGTGSVDRSHLEGWKVMASTWLNVRFSDNAFTEFLAAPPQCMFVVVASSSSSASSSSRSSTISSGSVSPLSSTD